MMPYGDANAIVLEMAREVLPIVRRFRCWPAFVVPILFASWTCFFAI